MHQSHVPDLMDVFDVGKISVASLRREYEVAPNRAKAFSGDVRAA